VLVENTKIKEVGAPLRWVQRRVHARPIAGDCRVAE
jgi:hypothetical protein